MVMTVAVLLLIFLLSIVLTLRKFKRQGNAFPPLNLNSGYQLNYPNVFVPWDVDEKELKNLLDEFGLIKVKHGYYYISCVSLQGLKHELGFHFQLTDEKADQEFENYVKSIGTIVKKSEPNRDPAKEGKLIKLEFFRKEKSDPKKSFDEFESFVEMAFGKPLLSRKTSGFPYHEWRFKGIKIYHYVMDRFGPEEHMAIERI